MAKTSLRLSRDIRPLTAFRANAAAFIEQLQSTKEPIVLTQHGRSAAVLLAIEAYESLIDELELLRDVRAAEREIASGQAEEQQRVEISLRALLGR